MGRGLLMIIIAVYTEMELARLAGIAQEPQDKSLSVNKTSFIWANML